MSRLEQLIKDREVMLHIKTIPYNLKEELESYYKREILSEESKANLK